MVARQYEEVAVPLSWFLRNPEFRLGFADARSRRPPRFDLFATNAYEVGRLFAIVAPPDMTPHHRTASRELRWAFLNGDIPEMFPHEE